MDYSSSRRRRRGKEPQTSNNEEEDAAALAAAEIAATLDSWTSPKLGSLITADRSSRPYSPEQYHYESDPVRWMQQETADGDDDNDDVAMGFATPAPNRPSRTLNNRRSVDRAETPVMSNSSSKKEKDHHQQQPQGGGDVGTAAQFGGATPRPVESPWVSQQQQQQQQQRSPATSQRLATSTTSNAIVARSRPSWESSHVDYARYHSTLLSYIKSKRSISEKMDWERQQRGLSTSQSEGEDVEMTDYEEPSRELAAVAGSGSVLAKKLVEEERRCELEYLRSLNGLCWDRAASSNNNVGSGTASFHSLKDLENPARREGNFWLLLASLRELGLDALIWSNDPAEQDESTKALTNYLQSLSLRTDLTPADLIQALQVGSSDCPMLLRRRQQILKWLQRCFNQMLPVNVTRPKVGKWKTNSEQFIQEGLPETDKDDQLLKASLALILAGRLEDANQLVRDSGVPWRAAIWSGGKPHGYLPVANDEDFTIEYKQAVGNSRRPLWRCMMWKLSEKLNGNNPAACDEEGAIAALLANHLKDALSNASLRSWEKGLYAEYSAVIGRTEDELLHMHNNQRREMRPIFPGCEFKEKERDHLLATSDVASMNEMQIIETLASSPFEEMQSDERITVAISSFLLGTSSIQFFMNESLVQLETMANDGNHGGNDAEEYLRLVTHLALYMDSLSSGSVPVVLDGVSQWKNRILLAYVNHLTSREDLWHMVVLYASLLPEDMIVECLPPLLVPIESKKERQVVVSQMREFLPKSGLDLVVLRNIVSFMLKLKDENMTDDLSADDQAISEVDVRKMNSILWLCFHEEHLNDALLATNTLLRHLLLADNKLRSAFMFMEKVLPNQIDKMVDETFNGLNTLPGDNDEDAVYKKRIESACFEYEAFRRYMGAMEAVRLWREGLAEKSVSPTTKQGNLIDKSRLNQNELAIANSLEKRELVEEKRKNSYSVVSSANKAREALLSVLECPGGWLLMEDDAIMGDNEENMIRRSELKSLRKKILPGMLKDYHEVCMETASWMSASLDDAVKRWMASTTEAAVSTLMEEITDDGPSPLLPRYWTQLALEAANFAVSDTNEITSVLSSGKDTKELLHRLAEAQVLDLRLTNRRDEHVSKW